MKPIVAYDPDFKLNRARVARWRYLAGHDIEFAPYDDTWGLYPERQDEIPRPESAAAFHLVSEDGTVYRNGAAAVRILAHNADHAWKKWLYDRVSAFRELVDTYYSWTSRHRAAADTFHTIFSGADEEPRTYFLTRWAFFRILAVVYLCAFASLLWQLDGLGGSNGITPIDGTVSVANQRLGIEGEPGPRDYWRMPTVFLFDASGKALAGVAITGVVASVILLAGFVPPLAALVAWMCYQSFVIVLSRPFLGYQWDFLLVEVGFLAIFFAPFQLRPGPYKRSVPSMTVLWLLRLVLFKLIFMSGAVKLNGPTWENLTALTYHYETQPLPTLFGWYAHHLPLEFHKAAVIGVFTIELIVPFLIIGPRRLRMLGGMLFLALQVAIGLTGNYGFFNLLTIALIVLLFDDAHIRRWISSQAFFRIRPPEIRPSIWPIRRVLTLALAVLLISLNLYDFARVFDRSGPPRWANNAYRTIDQFNLTSAYGLFARMTTSRPELIVEGSNDNRQWEPYTFRWKAGPLDRAPTWAQPHMPRLDWQMWFEALNAERGRPHSPWMQNFLYRLLNNEEAVVGLLEENPFPDNPPRTIRVRLYEYRFTDMETRRETGEWWTREEVGIYIPPKSLGP